jgi:hypothetical protein
MKRTRALEAIAYHHAGHVVLAWRTGVRVKAVSLLDALVNRNHAAPEPYFQIQLAANDPGVDKTLSYGLPSAESRTYRRRLENMALVCLAGPAAQRRFDPCGFRRAHALADRRQALAVFTPLAPDPQEACAYVELIDWRARHAVSLPPVWRCIAHAAGQILERVSLTAAEMRAVIKEGEALRSDNNHPAAP